MVGSKLNNERQQCEGKALGFYHLGIFPIYKGGVRSAVTNYRLISLTSVVCKQLEHVTAGYLWQVWDKNDWLYEGQHGFTQGYSCESQDFTVCEDIADSLDEGFGIYSIIIDFS